MKIKRFNESLKKNWNPTDKVLKVSIPDFEVKLEDIENTAAYQTNFEYWYEESKDKVRSKKNAIYYGIEEWIYSSGGVPNMKYELVDGTDTIITNEDEFDTMVKNSGKFNL